MGGHQPRQLEAAAERRDAGRQVQRQLAGLERRLALVQVADGADLGHGLLHGGLKRVVPEALKPRRIAIGSAPALTTGEKANDDATVIEHQAA